MDDKLEISAQQARVDAIFDAAKQLKAAARDPGFVPRLLELAHRGLVAPDTLDHHEIVLMCRTVIFKFAQDGVE